MSFPPIPVAGLTRGSVTSTDLFHLTGGLRARRVGAEGWKVGPLPPAEGDQGEGEGWIAVVPDRHLSLCASALGARIFGMEEVIHDEMMSRVWTAIPRPKAGQFSAIELWGFIATTAKRSGDKTYSRLAGSVSACLRASGLQLRNVSDCYCDQLRGALRRKAPGGSAFSNMALIDLHLACHSLMSEMGSARDYLATVAARRVGAPAKIDSLARLRDWASRSGNSTAADKDRLVAMLVEASDPTSPDPWLAELGEYRNLFLHRQPLGVDERANRLRLQERQTSQGLVYVIVMEIEVPIGSGVYGDALDRFVELNTRFGTLAAEAATLAAYPAEITTFVGS